MYDRGDYNSSFALRAVEIKSGNTVFYKSMEIFQMLKGS